ncbi:ferritin-like domain-containing protein [Rufibacter sediminis]|uniref:Ferritin-like domain-containing protein n=1 Tax=Rufibacter sediminis TaxID=2762756 RepID=A0ABR6VMP6_9BACT|nr:ferritin-like domain-containing protein [Rufibacter sediminis]MBC3538406.1 ferritin-like domain-containing protein [Rufibacter sediminis]
MNIFNILKEVEKVDPEIFDRLDPRRAVFKHFGGFGKKLAAAAIPVAFGSMLNKAYGQTSSPSVREVLEFALLLENLEYHFYLKAAATNIFPAPAGKTAFGVIRDHEKAHVDFLRTAISGLGGAAPTTYTDANFDWTADGLLGNATFTDYPTMLAVAQAFEDTGVRAYKGAAPALITNDTVLQAALQIHSVEARHAAHLRRMRRDMMPNGVANLKPWITMKDRGGLPAAFQGIYDGEEATTQASVNLVGTFNGIAIDANAASEAFDEPLTVAQVNAIVAPFIA